MAGPRRRSSLVRGPAHRTSWGDGPGGTGVRAISASGASFVGSAIQPTVEALTCIRIRGRLSWHLKSAAANGDGFAGAFAIGIASFAAVTAGVASVPTPITDRGSENWLYWAAISVHGATSGSLTAVPGALSERIEVDTKAMRRFPSDMAIYAMIDLVEIGTATADLFFDSRMLVKGM